ncbi:MAG: Ig-like domain-containing protein [Thermoleophilia bacterium]
MSRYFLAIFLPALLAATLFTASPSPSLATGAAGSNAAANGYGETTSASSASTSTSSSISTPEQPAPGKSSAIAGSPSLQMPQIAATDVTPPVITNVWPVDSSFINSSSITFSADYSDEPGGSGIDTTSFMVHVDNRMIMTGCTATTTHGSCPKSDLSNGSHTLEIFICDNANNCPVSTTYFTVDTIGPTVTYTGPTGPVGSSPTITGTATDANGVAAAKLNLNGGADSACSLDGAGNISCPTSGLADGPYSAVITATDPAGNPGTATGNFDVGTPGKPGLKLATLKVEWASYSDYTARRLSITYAINNTGASGARNAQLTGSTPSDPVTLYPGQAMPVAVGDLAAGGSASAVVQYLVPAGTARFQTTNTASAQDAWGNPYIYPV